MTTCEGFSDTPSSPADFSGDIKLNTMASRQGLSDIDQKDLLDLDSAFKLQKSIRYIEIMQKVEEDALTVSDDEKLLLDWRNSNIKINEQVGVAWTNFEVKYEKLILDCYALSVEIENEIVSIHNFVRDKYKLNVGELESLVDDPIEYARVVKRIGNELDLTTLVGNLDRVLPSAIVMVFCCWQIGKAIEACDRVVALDSAKKKLEDFLERRMGIIAPNLCAYIGSGVAAAKIMSTAGGLMSLAKMSGSELMCYIGAIARGYFEQYSPSIPDTRHVGNRAIHMGYLDYNGYYPSGNFGARTRSSLGKCIDAWRNDSKQQKSGKLAQSI